jgi:hypothetical protein
MERARDSAERSRFGIESLKFIPIPERSLHLEAALEPHILLHRNGDHFARSDVQRWLNVEIAACESDGKGFPRPKTNAVFKAFVTRSNSLPHVAVALYSKTAR